MSRSYVSTINPCRMCRPLGACLAFRGIENAMVLLHGSQGCSTYMRRFISSHFNEPVDIASSSLNEKSAVYGGEDNLRQAIRNVVEKYAPAVLGVATTCLTETIGDNVPAIIASLLEEEPALGNTAIVPVSTPSYAGDHMDGFFDTCRALVDRATAGRETPPRGSGGPASAINLFPGLLSPADIRHLQEIADDYQIHAIIVPDLSQSLDGPIEQVCRRIPAGGTSLSCLADTAESAFSIEFNLAGSDSGSAALLLQDRFGVKEERQAIPIGIRNCDFFFRALADMSLRPVPAKYQNQRGRLLDAMVDAHKYLFGKKVAIYGDADLVLALASFCVDLGLLPVVCATGSRNAAFPAQLHQITAELEHETTALTKTDFDGIGRAARAADADLLIGSSKGNRLGRQLGIPLLRVGFPIHDRIGAQRILHVGYRGTMNLLDLLTNLVIATDQERLGYDYSYM